MVLEYVLLSVHCSYLLLRYFVEMTELPPGHCTRSLPIASLTVLLWTLWYPWTGGSSGSVLRYSVSLFLNVVWFSQVVSSFGRQFHNLGPTTAKDVSYRFALERLQFLGRLGTLACTPNRDSGRNCTFRSLGILLWSIFHIVRMMNRSLRRCRDIKSSFLSLLQ